MRASKNPNARFAILYQNDDAGKDYLRGVKEALGADADKVIAMASSFEVADPTVDSQILTLANTKADVFLIYSVTPRACAQAIRKAYETGWRPMRFISSGCTNKDTVFVPAGVEASTGIMSVVALKPYSQDSKDAELLAYADFMKSRLPNVDLGNFAAGYGYMVAQALVVVLEQCKNDLSRANIMAQAANLKGVPLLDADARHHAQYLANGLPSDQGRLYGRVSRQPVERDQRVAAGFVTSRQAHFTSPACGGRDERSSLLGRREAPGGGSLHSGSPTAETPPPQPSPASGRGSAPSSWSQSYLVSSSSNRPSHCRLRCPIPPNVYPRIAPAGGAAFPAAPRPFVLPGRAK